MIFQILEPKSLKLTTVTNRREHHGDDLAPAVTLGIDLQTDNFFLDGLLPGLREVLYQPVAGDKQSGLDGFGRRTPKLRIEGLGEIPLPKLEFNGWTLHVDHGIKEAEPITLGGCKVDGFKLIAKQDSIIDLSWRIGTSDVDAMRLGLLAVKAGHDVSIRLVAPDGAQELAEKAKADARKSTKEQKKLEAAGQQRFDTEAANAEAATKEVVKREKAGQMQPADRRRGRTPMGAKIARAAAKKPL